MASEKMVNYSAEQTAEVVAQYKAGVDVKEIATAVGKSVRSVVAKLSREGVYVAKAKAQADARVTKEQLVNSIFMQVAASNSGVEREQLESLEKATHEALVLVLEALR